MQYVGSAKIDDWRYRSEADKIMTLFFKADYVSGAAKANDDLAELAWFYTRTLSDMVDTNSITAEHHTLVNMLITNITPSTETIKQ